MEIQKHQGGTELVNSKAVQSISRGNEIVTAINTGLQLSKCPTNDPMRQSFRYIFALMGLKEQSIPNDIEKQVLLENVQRYYGQLTAEEMKLAYQLALNGDLIDTVKRQKLDVRLYGDVYSYEHASMVFSAYIEQKRRDVVAAMNKAAQTIPEKSTEEKLAIRKEFIDERIMKPIKNFINPPEGIKHVSLNFGMLSPREVYSQMRNSGIIKYDQDKIQRIKKRVSTEVRKEWQSRTEAKPKSVEEINMMKVMKKALEGSETNPMNQEIIDRCHLEFIEFAIMNTDIDIIHTKLLTNGKVD